MSISHLMKEYFDHTAEEHSEIPIFQISQGMPVIPFKETWEVVDSPQRLMKDFKFKSFFYLKNFLNELIEYQEEINHHAKITVEHLEIRVEVHTHDVDEVTEIDLEYAKAADLIYEDIQHYENNYECGIRSY